MWINTESVSVIVLPHVRDCTTTVTLSAFTILISKYPLDYFELSIGIILLKLIL